MVSVTSTEVAAQAEAVKKLAEAETDPALKATLTDLGNVLSNISATLKSFEDLFRSRQSDPGILPVLCGLQSCASLPTI